MWKINYVGKYFVLKKEDSGCSSASVSIRKFGNEVKSLLVPKIISTTTSNVNSEHVFEC